MDEAWRNPWNGQPDDVLVVQMLTHKTICSDQGRSISEANGGHCSGTRLAGVSTSICPFASTAPSPPPSPWIDKGKWDRTEEEVWRRRQCWASTPSSPSLYSLHLHLTPYVLHTSCLIFPFPVQQVGKPEVGTSVLFKGNLHILFAHVCSFILKYA